MLKQTRFYLGLMLIVQAISCFFLVICYLFKDKKNTAGPFTVLGVLSAVAGMFLIAEKVKEHFEAEQILEAMDDICEDDLSETHTIPVDDTATESDFN
ncbi:MAG: hypothetical protein E7618_01375 [Ruminococcaceae bacterium]|nr:hypothetical protein [Oscillospiraceae bacterium]